MIRRPPRSTLFPYTRSSDLTTKGGYRMEYQHVLFPKVSKHTRHVILHMFRQMERQSEWERIMDKLCIPRDERSAIEHELKSLHNFFDLMHALAIGEEYGKEGVPSSKEQSRDTPGVKTTRTNTE